MNRTLAKTLIALGFVSTSLQAFAQDPPPTQAGWDICHDWENTSTPVDAPGTFFNSRSNALFRVTAGGGGTVNYFGSNTPCDPRNAENFNVAGRIGFASGNLGSIQDNLSGTAIDDEMDYTFGMPFNPAGNWSYATVRRTDPASGATTSSLVGSGMTGLFFSGASGRYLFLQNSSDGVLTSIRCDIVGDACRVNWTLTNQQTTAQELGIWYGAQLGILPVALGDPIQSGMPAIGSASGLFGGPVYNIFAGRKPLIVDTRITRANDPGNFPPFIQFCYGQTNAYGLQIDMGPTDATSDQNGNNSDATNVDEVVVGSDTSVVGDHYGTGDTNTMPDFIFGDVTISNQQFIIKYEPVNGGVIPVNGTRVINTYFRDTWGNSKYTRPSPVNQHSGPQPYTTVIDAPHLLTQSDTSGTNGLANNPFTLRVYIDNVGGYSDVYTSVPINDVHVHVDLPAGLSFINGDTGDKIITTVNPLQLSHVDFQVQSDGVVIGDLPYDVTITSTPGPTNPITHNGVISVSATKQIPLVPNANLISTPWVYTDSSWEAVLAPWTIPADFTVYDWDPVQGAYIVSGAAQRGKGSWLILNPNTHPSPEVQPYSGANTPTDFQTGFQNYQLHSGWNLIGNPYPYAVPVSQLVGVSAANSAQSYIFSDLVNQGIVSPYLAFWDPTVQNYRYVQGINAQIQPNQGYWIQVLTSQDLTLNYPPLFDAWIPGGKAQTEPSWTQSANHWRLNIQGRTSLGHDSENYIGVSTTQTMSCEIPKPPSAPVQDMTVAVDGSIAGMRQRLAQGVANHNGALQWTVYAQSTHGGQVTLTWPNMSTLPSNISFKIVDSQTHQSVDMRAHSSITYNSNPNQLKTFYVQSTQSSALPTIGSLTTTNGKLSTHISASATYSLNAAANTTVQVVDQQGNPVAVLLSNSSRPRGSQTLSWNLRYTSGGYVPAGTYQVVVTAQANGATDRKTANVTVLR